MSLATCAPQWPYTYDTCDVGTLKNQTLNNLPAAALVDGDEGKGGVLSYLPGQRLSRCTCEGESHPGPKHNDGTFVGRSAPEIDVFEAQIDQNTLVAGVSQSAQWAVSTHILRRSPRLCLRVTEILTRVLGVAVNSRSTTRTSGRTRATTRSSPIPQCHT